MKKYMITIFMVVTLFHLSNEVFGQRSYKEKIEDMVAMWEEKAASYSDLAQRNQYIYFGFLAIGVVATVFTALNKKVAATILTAVITALTQVSSIYDIQPQKYRWASERIRTDLERFKESIRDSDLNNPQIAQMILNQGQDLIQSFQKIEDEIINYKKDVAKIENSSSEKFRFYLTHLLQEGSLCADAKLNIPGKRFEAKDWVYSLSGSLVEEISNDQNNLYLVSIGTGPTLSEADNNERMCAKDNLVRFILYTSDQKATIGQQVAAETAEGIQKQMKVMWFKYEQRGEVYASCKLYRVSKKSVNSYYTNYNDVRQVNTQIKNQQFSQKLYNQKIIKR